MSPKLVGIPNSRCPWGFSELSPKLVGIPDSRCLLSKCFTNALRCLFRFERLGFLILLEQLLVGSALAREAEPPTPPRVDVAGLDRLGELLQDGVGTIILVSFLRSGAGSGWQDVMGKRATGFKPKSLMRLSHTLSLAIPFNPPCGNFELGQAGMFEPGCFL